MAALNRNSGQKWFQQLFSGGRTRRKKVSQARTNELRFEPLEERIVLAAQLAASWSAEATVFGDYNEDGMVDAADYTVWRENLGAVVAPGEGSDGSGDGRIGQEDFAWWRSNYGNDFAAHRVELSWAGVPEATSYNVKRSSVAGGPFTSIATDVSGTQFSDPAPAGGQYFYVVSAVGAWGEGQDSNVATPPLVLQAEDATLSGVVEATTDPGYFGDGYADFVTSSGSYIEWNLDAYEAGRHELSFRYALDATSSRPLKLTVNGSLINANVDFSTTGDWTSWRVVTVATALKAGVNTVRLTSTGLSGANVDQLTVTRVEDVTQATSNLRRPISPDQPMWLVHIDTWNYPDPQKIIDLIPEDLRPFVVMNISLSISHNADTGQFQVAEYGYEIAKSWMRVCAANGMWAMVQHSSGGFAQFSDFDLSVYEEFYRDFPNFIGFSYAEQFWGFDDPNDPLSAVWTDRIAHFANLLELSHQYGGYLVVSWNGTQWSPSINPIAMLKRNPEFEEASRNYTENFLLFEKYTTQTYVQDTESLALGAYLSGYSGNYGIRYDDTGWTDANGNHDNFTLVTGAAPQLEHAMLTGQTMVDGPELIWLQDFRELSRGATDNGYTERRWDTYSQFDNVSIDLFRKVLDGTVRIPSREEVIDRTKVVVINDQNTGSADDIYSSPETLFEGLYRMDGDGNYEFNKNFFKQTGRYPTVPTVYGLADELANSFEVQVNRTEYDDRWPDIASKVSELNSLFPQEYTGDLYAGRHENGWVIYNPYKTGQLASASIPFKYNSADRMELTYSQYTAAVVKEFSDKVTFYLNNYDNVIDTGLKTDTIKIYGAASEPTWSFADRGEHQSSIVTSDWSNGVLTLTVRHNGALDLTVNCSGTATDRLVAFTPASIVAPGAPLTYNGPLQFEAEVFDYQNINGVTTSGYSSSVRNYTGQGYLRFGTSSTAKVRDTMNVLKAGDYRLQTRYAVTGTNVSSIDLYVNGVKVADPVFTQTPTLNDWNINEQTISLVAGENTIEFRANGASAANIYFDNIVVLPTVYGDGMVIQEYEPGFAGVDGAVASTSPGYIGAGYADTQNSLGAGVDWALNLDSSTVKSFTFRYAGIGDRTADLWVNGQAVASGIQFASTGALSEWDYVTVYASVPAGASAVTLQSTSATGLPNIDSLEVIGATPWTPGDAPFKPVGLAATAVSTSQIDLAWWPSIGADSYTVNRASTSGGPYTTIAMGVTGTTFSATPLTELATYYFTISAENSVGQSEVSSEVTATTLTTNSPAAPMNVATVASAFDRIDLLWTSSLGADSYVIKRAINSGGPYVTVGINVTGTSFTETGLFGDTTYYYVVSAVNEIGEGAGSIEANATTLSTAILEPVADAYVRDGGYTNSNFGNDPTLAVKYDGGSGFNRNTFLRFDVSGLADAQYVQLTLTPNQVDAGDTMSYEIVSDDSWSETGVTWNNQPAGSGNLVASVSGFVVGQQRTVNITSAATSEAAGDGVLSLKLSKPNVGNNFVGFYSSEAGDTSLRPMLVATLQHHTYPLPDAPTNPFASGTSASEITLSWAAASAATKYNVRRSTVSGGPYTLVAAGVSGASYIDSGLNDGLTYYYTISSVNGVGESLESSEASAVPGIRYQEAGGVLSLEAENGTVGSRWMTIADASASNGHYIEIDPAYNQTGSTPESTAPEALATYEFSISTTGNYRFWVRTFAPDYDSDSFLWRIDSGDWVTENGLVGAGSWFSKDNTQVDNLGAGNHVLEVSYRENGAGLDKFVLQLDDLAAPSGNGPGESVPGAAPTAQLAIAAPVEADFLSEADSPEVNLFGYSSQGIGGYALAISAPPLQLFSPSTLLIEPQPLAQPATVSEDFQLLIALEQSRPFLSRSEPLANSAFDQAVGEDQEVGAEEWLEDLALHLAIDR